jgi:hypothetical protein
MLDLAQKHACSILTFCPIACKTSRMKSPRDMRLELPAQGEKTPEEIRSAMSAIKAELSRTYIEDQRRSLIAEYGSLANELEDKIPKGVDFKFVSFLMRGRFPGSRIKGLLFVTPPLMLLFTGIKFVEDNYEPHLQALFAGSVLLLICSYSFRYFGK